MASKANCNGKEEGNSSGLESETGQQQVRSDLCRWTSPICASTDRRARALDENSDNITADKDRRDPPGGDTE